LVSFHAVPLPSEEQFAIEVSRAQGLEADVVAIRGELDFGEATELARTLDRLRLDGARRIVLDLRDLSFIDSSGINVLVVAARGLSAEGGELIAAGARQHVQRVFDIVRLSEFVPVEGDLDAALERVSWRRGHPAG
jgi:stage II sporulation protein AA (anti-sigma F factor antagonist)